MPTWREADSLGAWNQYRYGDIHVYTSTEGVWRAQIVVGPGPALGWSRDDNILRPTMRAGRWREAGYGWQHGDPNECSVILTAAGDAVVYPNGYFPPLTVHRDGRVSGIGDGGGDGQRDEPDDYDYDYDYDSFPLDENGRNEDGSCHCSMCLSEPYETCGCNDCRDRRADHVVGYRAPEPEVRPFEFLANTVTSERKPLVKSREAYGKLILGRGFGVEIEYDARMTRDRWGYTDVAPSYRANPRQLALALNLLGLKASSERWQQPEHRKYVEWVCSTDSSVTGGECKSPILRGADAIRDLGRVMRTIRRLGGVVSEACGAHVHHDVTDLQQSELIFYVDNLAAVYDAVMTYIPEDREEESYCQRLSLDDLELVRSDAARDLLKKGAQEYGQYERGAFNFNSVLSYGSVEWRAHPGTLDAKLLEPWIATGQALTEFSRLGHMFGAKQTPQSMMETFVGERLIHVDLARRFLKRCADLFGDDAVVEPRTLLAA